MLVKSLVLSTIMALATPSWRLVVSAKDEALIGRRIWYNEARLSVDHLVHWNYGEEFAAMGIGHFVWYPRGRRGRFKEEFPGLLRFLRENGAQPPAWLNEKSPCPWASRGEFLAARRSPKAMELRDFLERTVPLQARFMVQRGQAALLIVVRGLAPTDRRHVESQFRRLANSAGGPYALIDYLNFKGDGSHPGERYRGEGWGLRQALRCMSGREPGMAALADFSACADKLLVRRVANSPRERGEKRWIDNWRARVATYRQLVHPAD